MILFVKKTVCIKLRLFFPHSMFKLNYKFCLVRRTHLVHVCVLTWGAWWTTLY